MQVGGGLSEGVGFGEEAAFAVIGICPEASVRVEFDP